MEAPATPRAHSPRLSAGSPRAGGALARSPQAKRGPGGGGFGDAAEPPLSRCGTRTCSATPTEGCYNELCSKCCREQGGCAYHKEVDEVCLEWLEGTKQRQGLLRPVKRMRDAVLIPAGTSARKEAKVDNVLETAGDSVGLVFIGDIFLTKAWAARLDKPSVSNTRAFAETESSKPLTPVGTSAATRLRQQADAKLTREERCERWLKTHDKRAR
jgi:hypothetical protein